VTHTALAARLRRLAEGLMALVEDLESEPAHARPAAIRQKERWIGPVPVEIRKQRQEAWGKRFRLAMELCLDPRPKYFGVMHNLHPCLVSRWLTGRRRSIAPGSAPDVNMWRMVNEDIAKFQAALATRHGAKQIANSALRISATMTA
jgi:hypothetical protein